MRLHFLAAAALVGLAAAQVTTDCDPLKKECPPDPAFGTEHLFHFNSTPNNELWESTAGPITYDEENGAAFTINKQGDSPTLRTRFYFFFGRTELWVKAAPGKGIISSMMWLSDDLDEVDWEFIGVNKSLATTNYYGKGVQVYTNGGVHEIPAVQDEFHNYTTVWTKDSLDWYINGNKVRSLTPDQANKTLSYPQTPMRLSVGIWAGGDPRLPKGTRDWAGGDTDYGAGPYTMYMKKAHITDYSSGKEYTYGDRSGKWESIKMTDGNSTAYEALNKQPEKTTAEKWNEMPTAAKAGIYGGGAAAGVGLIGVLVWYYIRQRRIGAQEAKLADERALAEQREMDNLEKRGINPDGFAEHGQEYDPKGMRNDGMADSDSYHIPETSASGPLDGGSWGNSAAAVPLMRGPMSPTHNGPPSPGVNRGLDFGAPAAGAAGMMRSQSPAMRSQSPGMPMHNQMRNGSAPGAYMRVGSPGPQQAYGAPQRMQSPGPMGPARSFTNNQPGYRGPPQGGNYYSQGGY